MKRLALFVAALLAAVGCTVPTSPDAARVAQARAALEAGSRSGVSLRVARN